MNKSTFVVSLCLIVLLRNRGLENANTTNNNSNRKYLYIVNNKYLLYNKILLIKPKLRFNKNKIQQIKFAYLRE